MKSSSFQRFEFLGYGRPGRLARDVSAMQPEGSNTYDQTVAYRFGFSPSRQPQGTALVSILSTIFIIEI